MRARKVCSNAQCGNLQPCPDHEVKAWSTSTRRERTVSGWEQQRMAQRVLKRDDGMCHVCASEGVMRPACTIVDHVIPLAEGGLDDLTNRAPICDTHHALKTAEESQRGRRLYDR